MRERLLHQIVIKLLHKVLSFQMRTLQFFSAHRHFELIDALDKTEIDEITAVAKRKRKILFNFGSLYVFFSASL